MFALSPRGTRVAINSGSTYQSAAMAVWDVAGLPRHYVCVA